MAERLRESVSPYLRAHADDPVDWYPWGEEAFAAAVERDVPVLLSIGYSTCHWCHVMARESFSDEKVAALLNENVVAIKVDREEHPEVDASYLAAAGAFTANLGWPLTVFATPQGVAFFAGTYYAPDPAPGRPSFRQIVGAVVEAWHLRRDEVEQTAASLSEAITAATRGVPARGGPDQGPAEGSAAGPSRETHARHVEEAVTLLHTQEDEVGGGFGGAPKFPVAPVLDFLAREPRGRALARRAFEAMARSPLRDAVDGGFFRYATRADWSEPHYERMLYDNALLLDVGTTLLRRSSMESTAEETVAVAVEGLASFLVGTLQLDMGGFASAQDSESSVDGERGEGSYYRLDADSRSRQPVPVLDAKVLTGWNGLAIGALAAAGAERGRHDWIASASRAAELILADHLSGTRVVARASVHRRLSPARPTLEDTGMLALGLLRLALASGEPRTAVVARAIVDDAIASAGSAVASPFAVPGGGDPSLAARGLTLAVDPSEGAYPSGLSAMAHASETLFLLTGEPHYRSAAEDVASLVVHDAVARPLGYGSALSLIARLARPVTQLVVVSPDGRAADGEAGGDGGPETSPSRVVAEARRADASLVAIVSETQARRWADHGFGLFAGRTARDRVTVYACADFVCRLPSDSVPEEMAPART